MNLTRDKSYFSLLDEMEKSSKLWQVDQGKIKVLLWKKGDKNRNQFWVKQFNKLEQMLLLSGESSNFKLGSDILGSFELNGIIYFFKSKVHFLGKEDIKITTSLDFYKSERRRSYRLLTYPMFSIYLDMQIKGQYQGSNVLNISTRVSQTGLFKNFLKLVDGRSEPQEGGSQTLRLRIQDLSVTGLSISIGEAELPYFQTESKLSNLKIVFPDENIEVKNAKVVYQVNLIGKGSRVRQYKIGIKFETNEAMDTQLSQKINRLLRDNDNDKDFEDFLS